MAPGFLNWASQPTKLASTLACFVVLLTFIVVWRLAKAVTSKAPKLPPGPRRWPIVGNLLQLGHLPHRDMAALSAAYGPLVYLRLGSVDAITTDDPGVIREIFLQQDDAFASRPRTLAGVHLTHDCRDVVLAPVGPKWKRMRRICMEHLLTTRLLDSFTGHREEEARHLVREVWKHAEAGLAVDLRLVLGAFSMNNITRMVLAKRYFGTESARPEEAMEFMDVIHELFRLLGMIYLGDYLPAWRWVDPSGCERKMRELERKWNELLTRIIEEHKWARGREKQREGAGDDRKEMDFVDVLLSLPGEDGKEHLDDVEIKALIQDMISAGTDTSSVMNEWAMTEVMRNPPLLRKIQEELDAVVGHDRMVTEADLAHLNYLRCVVRETFRMHPPAPFLVPHESVRPTRLLGYDIPARTRVFVNLYAHGRNPRVWDDVHEFKPERHMRADGGRVEISHGPDFEILPFGAGRRRCPAASFGLVFVLMALARLFHCFDWFPPEGLRPEDIDTGEVYGMTMHKAKPLVATARPRLPPHLYA